MTDFTPGPKCFAAYALIAVLTFGHAWNSLDGTCGPDGDMQCPADAKFIAAAGSSIGWPLYWSVQIWRKAEGGKHEG